jgi:hypothetical protein
MEGLVIAAWRGEVGGRWVVVLAPKGIVGHPAAGDLAPRPPDGMAARDSGTNRAPSRRVQQQLGPSPGGRRPGSPATWQLHYPRPAGKAVSKLDTNVQKLLGGTVEAAAAG